MPVNAANPNIKHVFVLMLENRSYDHMIGFLNADISKFSNAIGDKIFPAHKGALPAMPVDPGHEFPDVMEQLCGLQAKNAYMNDGVYPPINNSGFVTNYNQAISKKGNLDVAEIMNCYNTATQLPIMAQLAENFAVCSNWFSSLPGPTWPNRFFVHAASSCGLDHSPSVFQIAKWQVLSGFRFPNGNIFTRLKENSRRFRLYKGRPKPRIGSIPCVAALKGIHLRDTVSYDQFEADINGDYPYDYTFIEPNYGDFITGHFSGGQSQHPMDDVRGGEELIKSTYEALRKSPLWESSMLIITYDEHGGFYDHVPPPAAIPPGDISNSKFTKHGFAFNQYGVRVPAIVISAYTKPAIDTTIYDHASVPATLEAMFNMQPLTKRDAKANNVTQLASLKTPRQTPEKLELPAVKSVVRKGAVKIKRSKVNEATEPADSGNLPGFLHIIMKADVEERRRKAKGKGFKPITKVPDEFVNIQTKAQARKYIESRLEDLPF